jgi:hypothetical protein
MLQRGAISILLLQAQCRPSAIMLSRLTPKRRAFQALSKNCIALAQQRPRNGPYSCAGFGHFQWVSGGGCSRVHGHAGRPPSPQHGGAP